MGLILQKPCMLALAGQPSLHGSNAFLVFLRIKEALRRNCRQNRSETSFSLFFIFLFSQNSRKRYWSTVLWHLWVGRAKHPGPPSLSRHVGIEFLNVGGWLTHGGIALEVGVDFLAVAEHRLIPGHSPE